MSVEGSNPSAPTPALVAQRTEHQVPNLTAASSNLAEGTHGRMSEWSRSWSANQTHAGSIPAAASYAIHCGLSQAGAGCPSAPHKGGAPGSTPGSATDGRGYHPPAATDLSRPPVRSCRLLRLVRISR